MEPDKKKIEIEVRGKIFKIDFVSNWVIVKYEQMNSKLQKLQELYNKLELIPPKEEIKNIVSEIKELGTGLLDEKLEIIEEILTGNDIEYDRKWWERKTDAKDIALFLNKCVFKDTIIGKKKVAGN